MEVINFPAPRAAVKFSSPVVQRARARGIRWKESPKPSTTAIMPNKRYWLFWLFAIVRTPMVRTVHKYTASNKVSTIACIPLKRLPWMLQHCSRYLPPINLNNVHYKGRRKNYQGFYLAGYSGSDRLLSSRLT